ncbi:hypothetical protein Bca4012_072750 [Brassica carinata]
MLKQDSKRQSTSTPASFRRLEEQESRYSTEQGSDKLVTEDIETYAPERASPQDPRRIKLQNEDMRHTLKLAEKETLGDPSANKRNQLLTAAPEVTKTPTSPPVENRRRTRREPVEIQRNQYIRVGKRVR